MRYRSEVGRRNHRRVLMAVYWLSDDDSPVCDASTPRIAAQAGVSVPTARKHLRGLEEDGIIAAFYLDRWANRRAAVILDDPDADEFLNLYGVVLDAPLSRYSSEGRQRLNALRRSKTVVELESVSDR